MQSLQDHFLIAMPAMADPNFNETVTYICKHDTEGAFGIVINRPSDLSLGEMLTQLAINLTDRRLADRPIMHGGPVEPERGFVLHRSDQAYEATLAAGSEIKLTSSPDVLAALGRGTGPEPVLVALGYAGWGRGQLEIELGSNTWLTVPANPTIIFETPCEQRWTAALGLPGVDIRRITHYAGHA
ncbi:MAG TPA: YqgE/AlgH family protein [Gammaproteobacteria bacterium]|nr:YqgE/AlgH family protein [Gammaproteobacteria bacterium]